MNLRQICVIVAIFGVGTTTSADVVAIDGMPVNVTPPVLHPISASEFDVKSATLQLLWSTPISSKPGPPPEVGKPLILPRQKGLVLREATVFSDERIAFLGILLDDPALRSQVLLTNAEKHDQDRIAKLQLLGTQTELPPPTFWEKLFGINSIKPSNSVSIYSIAADGSDAIWVGGSTHFYMGIASDPNSDAYLSKFDSAMKPLWARSYKAIGASTIVDMAPTTTGDLIVMGNDGPSASSWLALIAGADGRLRWKQTLGSVHGGAIVRANDDRYIIASFDSEGVGANYQENVSVRNVTVDGQLGPATVTRHAINKWKGGSYGRIRMSPTTNGVYVVSNWEVPFLQDPSLFQPSEVTKVSSEGKLLWSKVMPNSFALNTDRGGATFCQNPAIATLPNGDALLACALNGRIHLHRFDQNTGDDVQGDIGLPQCDGEKHSVSLFLFVRKDGQVLLGGSLPGNSVASGCSWLGHLAVGAR